MNLTFKQYGLALLVAVAANWALVTSIVWLNEIGQPEEHQIPSKLTHFEIQNPTPESTSPIAPAPSIQAATLVSLSVPKLALPSAIKMSRALVDDWNTVTNFDEMNDEFRSNDLVFKEDAVDKPAHLIAQATPRYPRLAERQGISGVVVFRIIVGVDGNVENVQLLKAEPTGIFESSAESAIRQYRYSPAQMDGQPVRSFYRQKIIFRVRD